MIRPGLLPFGGVYVKNALKVAAKAWVAAVAAALAAALPQIQEATNGFLATVVATVIAGGAVYLVPNKPTQD